jgi:hypothetical protein
MDAPGRRLLGDLGDAIAVGRDFWAALGTDDWAACEPLLSTEWVADADEWFPERYRVTRNIPRDLIAGVNFYNEVEILAVDRIRTRWTLEPGGPSQAGEGIIAWRLELVFEAGAWKVGRSTERQSIGNVPVEIGRPNRGEPRDSWRN